MPMRVSTNWRASLTNPGGRESTISKWRVASFATTARAYKALTSPRMRAFTFYSGNSMINLPILTFRPWTPWRLPQPPTFIRPKWCTTTRRSTPPTTKDQWPACSLARAPFQALADTRPRGCRVPCHPVIPINRRVSSMVNNPCDVQDTAIIE